MRTFALQIIALCLATIVWGGCSDDDGCIPESLHISGEPSDFTAGPSEREQVAVSGPLVCVQHSDTVVAITGRGSRHIDEIGLEAFEAHIDERLSSQPGGFLGFESEASCRPGLERAQVQLIAAGWKDLDPMTEAVVSAFQTFDASGSVSLRLEGVLLGGFCLD